MTDTTNGSGNGVAAGGPEAAVYWFGGDARWQSAERTPLTRTVRADVCIVGGGFSGLWAAYWIKRLQPGAEVVLLEREFCGAGASGRNGGWVNGWEDSIGTLVARFGAEAAAWLLEASLHGTEVMARGRARRRHRLRPGLRGGAHHRHVTGAARRPGRPARGGRGAGSRRASACPLAPTRLARRAARRAPMGGLLLSRAGSVQPALLVQGLRRLAVEAGVRVFEASPMTRLERGLPAVVETPGRLGDRRSGGAHLRALARRPARAASHAVRHPLARRGHGARLRRCSTPWAGAAAGPSPMRARRSTTVSAPATTASCSAAAAAASASPGTSSRRTSTTRPRSRRSRPTCTSCCRDVAPDRRRVGVGGTGRAHPARHALGRRPRPSRQHPLRHRLLRQRGVSDPADRPHARLGRPAPDRRLRRRRRS